MTKVEESKKDKSEADLKNIAKNFVSKLSKSFLTTLKKDEGTTESDGVTVCNDGAFYFLIGQYIDKDKNYSKIYDELDQTQREDIDEIVSDLICTKFKIEF